VVPKADRSVRICGDSKVSVNPSVDDAQITLPTTQDLYVQMAGCQVFTKLDLSRAYAQLKVDEASKSYGSHAMQVPMGWAQFCPMSLKMVTNDLSVMLPEL